MTELAPFRERPKFLLCPRCGEMLERAFEAVLTCLRCEGIWLAVVMMTKAFGDPKWPGGAAMWWRNSLECPECASEGAVQTMTAVRAGDVVLDRCGSHGVWLDRSELARLMGRAPGEGGGAEIALLREKLVVDEDELGQLARRRAAWRDDLDQRRQAAQEYRAWLEVEQQRREAREREERSQAAREREARVREQLDALRAREQLEAARREVQAREQLDALRAREKLEIAREEAASHVERTETQIIMLRNQLRTAEAELDGARVRLRAVDDQLAQLRGRGA